MIVQVHGLNRMCGRLRVITASRSTWPESYVHTVTAYDDSTGSWPESYVQTVTACDDSTGTWPESYVQTTAYDDSTTEYLLRIVCAISK